MNTSSTSDPVLRAEHLARSVQGKVIVDDVSFSLRKGEVLALVGPSGSGKTSLLRMLNRLDEPTAGTVFVENTDYRTIPHVELRRKLGLVTQRPFLFPGTVTDNLQFGPRQRGELLSSASIEDLLARVGLGGYGNRDISHLSGGEAQRVSVARTLANSPLILLLDEPTSALDEASKREVEKLIQSIVRAEELTCVIVTHDSEQARRLAQSALLLQNGKTTRSGTAAEVFNA